VRLTPGAGTLLVNGRTMEEYFPREVLQIVIKQPLEVAGAVGRYDIHARVDGGGPSGQAGALRHGIARAIEKLEAEQRPGLKKAGLLTRDARKKERKKYGQRGARARFQFSKR
jgi:small subunit ribosomal protein S9